MKTYDAVLKSFAGVFGIIFLIIIIFQLPSIIPFQYSPTGSALVVVPTTSLLESISDYMWNARVVDTLVQVIVLFVAAAGAAALFRLEKRTSVESEAKELEGQ
ncbi:MAG: hypothetical protein ACTSYR_05440 [Candidatus Odinarchaeia archaeon]